MKPSAPLPLFLAAGVVSACSVRFVATDEVRVTTNQCSTSRDCGPGASCSAGACFATSGTIDDVLLEVVPEASSSGGGLSFLSSQAGVGSGNRHLNLALKAASFSAAIKANTASFPTDCTQVPSDQISVGGVIEFTPASSNADFPTYGLVTTPVTVNVTPQTMGGVFGRTLLAPGTYDIYVQPKSPIGCALPPLFLRGVDISSDPPSSAPPVTLMLAAPTPLFGMITRNGPDSIAALAGWQVDLIEPQNGRVISTSASWAKDATKTHVSNFSISYQPVVIRGSNSSSTTGDSANNSPILRLRPPDSGPSRAPTVYWALSAIDFDGDGKVNIDMSALPTSNDLVPVNGQVLGGDGNGVRASVQFVSTSLDGTMGLTASFVQSIATDASGAYATTLFPGDYKVVAVASPDGAAGGTTTAQSPWAVSTQEAIVGGHATPSVDIPLVAKRIVRGTASVAMSSTPALGSVVQATPTILPDRVGVWRGALAQTPIVPNSANTAVSQVDGSFTFSLDPGLFDLSVQAADGSHFAWWVWPRAEIDAPASADDVFTFTPQLPFPVPIEGTLSDGELPLANALVHAYAKVPGGTAITKVGDTRTDSSGHYLMLLPPGFGGP